MKVIRTIIFFSQLLILQFGYTQSVYSAQDEAKDDVELAYKCPDAVKVTIREKAVNGSLPDEKWTEVVAKHGISVRNLESNKDNCIRQSLEVVADTARPCRDSTGVGKGCSGDDTDCTTSMDGSPRPPTLVPAGVRGAGDKGVAGAES